MHTAVIWGWLGGLSAALAIIAALVKISFQLGDYVAEQKAWRDQMERRVNGLESAVYLPRHRQHK